MVRALNRKSQIISFVIPAYNESAGILRFHEEILMPEVKKATSDSYEVIYVNDGSKDNTLEILHQIAKKDKSVRVVSLSRNFGKEIATTAGIHQSVGDAVIIMDGDGQHPPALIGELIEQWRSGAQVVVGVRNSNQKEGAIKKWGSKVFYKLFNSTSGTEIVPRSTDFRLIDSAVRTEFMRFPERNRITRGLIDWLGFKRAYVAFDSPARIAGEASYKTSQLVKLALNSFVSLSLKPLFIFGWIGVGIIIISITFGLFIIIEQFILGDPMALHFSSSVMLGTFTSFLVGLVLVSQAMLATYISHIHVQTQGRPLFVVDESSSVNITQE